MFSWILDLLLVFALCFIWFFSILLQVIKSSVIMLTLSRNFTGIDQPRAVPLLELNPTKLKKTTRALKPTDKWFQQEEAILNHTKVEISKWKEANSLASLKWCFWKNKLTLKSIHMTEFNWAIMKLSHFIGLGMETLRQMASLSSLKKVSRGCKREVPCRTCSRTFKTLRLLSKLLLF